MLGDQADKTKQSGFIGIRKRRKNVSFAPPTFVDYSDFDYSTDEEDIDELFGPNAAAGQQKASQQKDDKTESSTAVDSADETAKVEPLKPRVNKDVKMIEPTVETVEEEDETRDSEDLDRSEGPSRSRNGTVRNTDSFFKDDSVETKKITLTPNLLRDDNTPRDSSDSFTKDLKGRTSLDKMDKELMSDKEKKKNKDKKEKDKKPSAIRSFFSRKDRKKTGDPDDDDSLGKRSIDTTTDSQGRDSEDPSIEEQASPERQAAPLRNPSKLQKQPRAEPPVRKGSTGSGQPSTTMELASYLAESRTNDVSNVPPASMRIVDPETQETQEIPSNQRTGGILHERSASVTAQREEKSMLSKVLPRSASAAASSRPQKTVKAKTRMDLEDLASEDEEEDEEDDDDEPLSPRQESNSAHEPEADERKKEKALRPQLPGAFPDSFQSTSTVSSDRTVRPNDAQQERLSESPVHVSPVNVTNPPPLEVDTSSQEGRSSEEVSSPELVQGRETPKDSSSVGSGKEATWDDEKLRTFFDQSEHVRDLLVVVYDKSDVIPAGKEHPVVGGLFREQNAKLAEITTVSFTLLDPRWLAGRLVKFVN